MIIVELVYNLSLLVALSIVSGYFNKRYPKNALRGILIQGVLFGSVAIVGMMRSLVYSEGLIFDGRSVVITLSTIFFGPISGSIASAMAIIFRIIQGGAGTFTGILVIISSLLIGTIFHFLKKNRRGEITVLQLLFVGIVVHIVMLLLMFTLPIPTAILVVHQIGITVIICYPIATVLIGKILSDQQNNIEINEQIRASEIKYSSFFENSMDAMLLTIPDKKILSASPAACKMFGYSTEEFIHLPVSSIVDETDSRLSIFRLERKTTGSTKGELTFITKDGSRILSEISSSIFLTDEGSARASVIIRDITTRKKPSRP